MAKWKWQVVYSARTQGNGLLEIDDATGKTYWTSGTEDRHELQVTGYDILVANTVYKLQDIVPRYEFTEVDE